eukprot:4691964-Pleurochrysis_carterae.AAC.1
MARSLAVGLPSASPLRPRSERCNGFFLVWRGFFCAVRFFVVRLLVLDLRLASAAVVSACGSLPAPWLSYSLLLKTTPPAARLIRA